MAESPEEKEALAKKGDPVPEPVDDPDPGDEHGLREALHGDDTKT